MEYKERHTEQDIIDFLREGSFIKTYENGSVWFTDKAAMALSKCPPDEDLRTEIYNYLKELNVAHFECHNEVETFQRHNRNLSVAALVFAIISLSLLVVQFALTCL